MHASSILILLAATVVVTTAAPSSVVSVGSKNHNNGNTCSHHHKKACCHGKEGTAVIGAKCSLLSSLEGVCKGGNVQCCNVDETGALSLLDVCIPL